MSFRVWWRDRSSAFWGVVFPLMLMGLLGSAFGRPESLTFTVAFVGSAAPEGGDVTGSLAPVVRQALAAVPVLKVVDEPREQALAALRKGDRTLVVDVAPATPDETAGAGQPLRVDLYFDEAHEQAGQAAIAVVQEALRRVEQAMTGAPRLFSVSTHSVTGRQFRMFDFLLPGVGAMSIMQTGLMGVSWSIADYRERRMLKRVLATPFHPMGFLGGLLTRFTLVTLLQSALIFAVGVYGFGARVVGSVWVLFLLAALGSMAFLSVGLAISTLAPTAESANIIGSLLNFPMMFLSGTFWPKDIMPASMQPLVGVLPLTPLVDSMRAVSIEGASLAPYAGGLAYLVAWGAVALAIAAWRFRWE